VENLSFRRRIWPKRGPRRAVEARWLGVHSFSQGTISCGFVTRWNWLGKCAQRT